MRMRHDEARNTQILLYRLTGMDVIERNDPIGHVDRAALACMVAGFVARVRVHT